MVHALRAFIDRHDEAMAIIAEESMRLMGPPTTADCAAKSTPSLNSCKSNPTRPSKRL